MVITTIYQNKYNTAKTMVFEYDSKTGFWTYQQFVLSFKTSEPAKTDIPKNIDDMLSGYDQIHHDNGTPVDRNSVIS